MKKIVAGIVLLAFSAAFGAGGVAAAEYPLKTPKSQEWSFAGPFGNYDKGQLQRGLKVYAEVCAACHSMTRVAFRTLEDLGYSEAQVKARAKSSGSSASSSTC